MDTTLYYFFSTLAQVIAAIVALTGVFAIFKIRLLTEEIEGRGQVFFDFYKRQLKISALRKAGINVDYVDIELENNKLLRGLREAKISRDYDKLQIMMDSCTKDPELEQDSQFALRQVINETKNMNNKRSSLKTITINYVVYSLGVILYSMMAIAFKSIILGSCPLRIIVYLAAFVFIAINFYLLAKLIKRSL